MVATPAGRVSAEPTAELTEEEVVRSALQAEYEIRAELGRGGMAIVYRALDRQLEREVAIKVLPFSLAFDSEFVERFQREARTAARLEHPDIIPIYRVGRSGRVIYFVMKLLRGTSLSAAIEQRGPLPVAEIRRMLIQTANALGYAHTHGIVHRDVKPDNIMFDELGHAVVTDFGIAKAATGTRLTGTGMAIGTPHYMSPEQARAQSMDGRSDLYSLGVVAYQCLAGRVPFDGDDAFSIGYKHIMEELPAPPLESVEARRLFAVIRRMMAKAPEDRYQAASELVSDLQASAGAPATAPAPAADLTTAATVAMPAGDVERLSRPAIRSPRRQTTPTTPMPRTHVRGRPVGKKRGGALVVAASVLMLLGGGGVGGYYLYMEYLAPRTALTAAPPEPVTVDRTFLTLPPVDAPALLARDSATRADSIRLASLPDSGWLAVVGAPNGARFWVDEVPYQTSLIRLGIGSHRLQVRATGFQEYATLVAVGKGDSLVERVQLARAAAPPRPRAPATGRPAESEGAGTCASPFEPTYNKDGACFDTPPSTTGNLLVPLDGSVSGAPRPVFLWVKVGPDGAARDAQVQARPTDDPAFVVLARTFARAQRYRPALKGGRTVDAWFQFHFVPQPR
jgi:serine/threonine protein kinase